MRHLRKAKQKYEEEKMRKERRSKRYLNQSQTNCAICLDLVTTRGILSVCDHWFCFECINEWSKNTNTCPLCKERFRCITKYTFSTDSPQKVIRIKDKNLSVVEYHDDDLQVALGLASDASTSSIDFDDPNDETFEISSHGDDHRRQNLRSTRGSNRTQSRQRVSMRSRTRARQRVASQVNTNTDGVSQSPSVRMYYLSDGESSINDLDSDTTRSVSGTSRNSSSIAPANSIICSTSSISVPGNNKSANINKSGKKRKRRKTIAMPTTKRRSIQSKPPANNNGWIDMSTKNRSSTSTQARQKKSNKVKVTAHIKSSDSKSDDTDTASSDDDNFKGRSLNGETPTRNRKLRSLRSRKQKKEIISDSSSEEDSEIETRNITNKKKSFAVNLRVSDDDPVESSGTETEGAYTQYVRSIERRDHSHGNEVSKSGNSSKSSSCRPNSSKSSTCRPKRNTQPIDYNEKCSTSINQCNLNNKFMKNNLRTGVRSKRMQDQEPYVPQPLRPRRSTSNQLINYKEADVCLEGSSDDDSNSIASDSITENDNNSFNQSKAAATGSKSPKPNDSSSTIDSTEITYSPSKCAKSYLRRTIDKVIQKKSLIDVSYENNLINETNDNVLTDSLFGDLRDETSVSSVLLSPCVLSQDSIFPSIKTYSGNHGNKPLTTASYSSSTRHVSTPSFVNLAENMADSKAKTTRIHTPSFVKTSSNVNNISDNVSEVTNKTHENRIETTPDKKFKRKWKFRKM